ncbi:MAG: hypothetical protein R6V84_16245 [Desulfobacterales bacterium]
MAAIPGGYLSDRIGIKRSLLLFNLVAIAGFIVAIAIPSWQAVILGSVFFISWSSIYLPATMGLIEQISHAFVVVWCIRGVFVRVAGHRPLCAAGKRREAGPPVGALNFR